MEFYKVRNAVETSDNKPPTEYSSWIEYWEGRSNIFLHDAARRFRKPLQR
jgi:hypothetical protein